MEIKTKYLKIAAAIGKLPLFSKEMLLETKTDYLVIRTNSIGKTSGFEFRIPSSKIGNFQPDQKIVFVPELLFKAASMFSNEITQVSTNENGEAMLVNGKRKNTTHQASLEGSHLFKEFSSDDIVKRFPQVATVKLPFKRFTDEVSNFGELDGVSLNITLNEATLVLAGGSDSGKSELTLEAPSEVLISGVAQGQKIESTLSMELLSGLTKVSSFATDIEVIMSQGAPITFKTVDSEGALFAYIIAPISSR